MHAEYVKLIADLDSVISTIREFWMAATEAAEKNKWRVRIDELLDQRIKLMAARDAAKEVAA